MAPHSGCKTGAAWVCPVAMCKTNRDSLSVVTFRVAPGVMTRAAHAHGFEPRSDGVGERLKLLGTCAEVRQ
jgi:hypothetical protein